jgi:hypothetical protein
MLSFTITLKEAVLVLPEASVALIVTTVTPNANTLPDAGADISDCNEQLSVACKSKYTTLLQLPSEVPFIISLIDPITGFLVSFTQPKPALIVALLPSLRGENALATLFWAPSHVPESSKMKNIKPFFMAKADVNHLLRFTQNQYLGFRALYVKGIVIIFIY